MVTSAEFDRQSLDADVKCYEYGDEPINTGYVRFTPREYFTDYYNENQKQPDMPSPSVFAAVSLDIRQLPLPNGLYRQETFETFDESTAEQLPDESGFKVYTRQVSSNIYGSIDRPEKVYVSQNLRTPKGNPVVFVCRGQNIEFRQCGTLIVINNVSFDITKINTENIPVKEWSNFYKQMQTFLDQIIVRDDEHLKSLTKDIALQKPLSSGMAQRADAKKPPQVCKGNGFYLQIGELHIYFPYKHLRDIGWVDTSNLDADVKCYEYGDEPVSTLHTKLSPRAYFTDYYNENQKPLHETGSGFFMAVTLDIRQLPLPNGRYQKEFFETFDESTAEPLPDEYGFKVYMRQVSLKHINLDGYPEKIYVSQNLRTPKGNPVVFVCRGQNIEFRQCESRIVIKNVSFDITKVDTGHIPVKEWSNFYKQMQAFLDQIIVRDDEHLRVITQHLSVQK